MLRQAVSVVSKYFYDRTPRDWSARAIIQHSDKVFAKRCQSRDALVHLIQVATNDRVGAIAWLVRLFRDAGEQADIFQRQAESPRVPNERQPLHMVCLVTPLTPIRSARRRQ